MKAFVSKTILILALFAIPSISPADPSQNSKTPQLKPAKPVEWSRPPRMLVLGLDGVSYQVFKKMYEGGYFQAFKKPAPMVATFPSISDPNWNRLMNTPVDESYTKIHFDRQEKTEEGNGKPKGNLLTNLKAELSYYKAFDYHPESELETFSIVGWTETTGKYILDSIEKHFFESTKTQPYMAYVMNSDMLSHMGGEKELMKFLKRVDKKINQIRRRHVMRFGEELDVVLISDHGNSYVTPKFVDFENDLKAEGWDLLTTLKDKNDVAIVIPEILSFGAFYTFKGEEKKFAKSLVKSQGVDLTSYSASKDSLFIYGDSGESWYEFKINEGKKQISLKKHKGDDFLGIAKLFSKAKKQRVSWDNYFYASLSTNYPNGVLSLWEGFYQNSQQGASVLASTLPDYAFANDALMLVSKLKGELQSLHGSLHKDQTYGVFVSTIHEVDAIRPADFLKTISSAKLSASK